MRPSHILKAAAVVLNTALLAPLVAAVSMLDRDARFGYWLALVWVRLNLLISRVRIVVRGQENLEPNGAYVFMSNHRSNADIVAIAWALRGFQLRWVAKTELLKVPLFGWGLRALKNVIIDRSNREEAIASYRRARERMERGISVMVFPEGTRGAGDDLLPFKKGGFVFALETEKPIVPIAVLGTAKVLARHGWKLERGVVEVRIGRPIPTAGRTVSVRDRLVEEVRDAIGVLLREPSPGIVPGRAVGSS